MTKILIVDDGLNRSANIAKKLIAAGLEAKVVVVKDLPELDDSLVRSMLDVLEDAKSSALKDPGRYGDSHKQPTGRSEV